MRKSACCGQECWAGRASRAAFVLVLTALGPGVRAEALGTGRCTPSAAELISIEGRVEWQSSDATSWLTASHGEPLCDGDRVRVDGYSRAALRLADGTVLRLDQNTVLTLATAPSRASTWVDLLRGVIHVISRDPRALSFRTPFANAGLEGTEFVVAVEPEQAIVTVIEGVVDVNNAAGRVHVGPGHRALAQPGAPPTMEASATPLAAARWAFHYAPVLDPRPAADDDVELRALRAVAGDIRTGRVEVASAQLRELLVRVPDHSLALALATTLALAENDMQRASRLAEQARASAPHLPAVAIAVSFVQQVQQAHDAARETVTRALMEAPDEALLWARLAEVELAQGNSAAGLRAANEAVTLDPALGYAHAMRGFALLNSLQAGAALGAFEEAIVLEQDLALAHLGRGLSLLISADLTAARRSFEVAVLLDPTNAVIRSYAAKAYLDEGRAELAAAQLELAKSLNPHDPTAWIYDALRKQAENRPAAALADWQHSVALNAGRGVQRSRLLLDEDIGTRNASVARIYRELGFEQLALADAWRTLAVDASDYSAHRLLADTYTRLPRHQIARVNELYQAQLLQPFLPAPIAPQLAQTGLFIADQVGPMDLAFTEFNPLLNRRRFDAEGAAVTGGNGISGQHIVATGVHERLTYSLGHFGYATDGFRENNDFDSDLRSAFLQYRVSDRHSFQLELRSNDVEKGDLRLLFSPDTFNPLLRQAESSDQFRFGSAVRLTNGVLLGAVSVDNGIASLGTGPSFNVESESRQRGVELVYLHELPRWQLQTGVAQLARDQVDVQRFVVDSPSPPFDLEATEIADARVQHFSVFGYAHYAVTDALTATFGASADALDGQSYGDMEQWNPKLGLTWRPTAATSIRVAALRTLQGPFVSKQNIQPRLEPTQVAGFNQFFFGSEGEDARRFGVGIDHRISARWYVGGELARRNVDTPITLVSPDSPLPSLAIVPVEEVLGRMYGYWMPNEYVSFGTEYLYESFDNKGFVLFDGFAKLNTQRVPLRLKVFAPWGLSAGITATHVDQRGDFGGQFFGTEEPTVTGKDAFWILDGSLSYRLPNRHGLISLGIFNLLDEKFRFQDTDPESPTIMPERLLALRFTLAY